jgi:hypothetical protein
MSAPSSGCGGTVPRFSRLVSAQEVALVWASSVTSSPSTAGPFATDRASGSTTAPVVSFSVMGLAPKLLPSSTRKVGPPPDTCR